MKEKTLLVVIFLLIYLNPVYSQEDDVQRFNQTRNHINKTAMITLGSWAPGNSAVNSAIYQQGEMASD